MDVLFVASVVSISATGALSPGPLSIITLALGAKGGWRSGFQIALGHMIFEFPYVVFLTTLYGSIVVFLELEIVKYLLTAIIVAFNSFFAYLLMSDAMKPVKTSSHTPSTGNRFASIKHPLLVGLILTGLNPFFLLWWATVGMPLIDNTLKYGITTALPVMYFSHVWLDFVWLSFLAHTSSKGAKHLGSEGYRLLLLLLSAVLMVFAINMVFKTFFKTTLIPL